MITLSITCAHAASSFQLDEEELVRNDANAVVSVLKTDFQTLSGIATELALQANVLSQLRYDEKALPGLRLEILRGIVVESRGGRTKTKETLEAVFAKVEMAYDGSYQSHDKLNQEVLERTSDELRKLGFASPEQCQCFIQELKVQDATVSSLLQNRLNAHLEEVKEEEACKTDQDKEKEELDLFILKERVRAAEAGFVQKMKLVQQVNAELQTLQKLEEVWKQNVLNGASIQTISIEGLTALFSLVNDEMLRRAQTHTQTGSDTEKIARNEEKKNGEDSTEFQMI